jgi:2-C-methyl-D-erythritol 4-phosphate cytidylyltransferase
MPGIVLCPPAAAHSGTAAGYRAGMPTAAAVVLAGGSGTRLGAEGNKVYLPLAGRPLLTWSLAAFAAAPSVGRLVLVTRAADRAHAERAAEGLDVEIVPGGATRHDSEWAALRLLAPAIRAGELDVVAIHDGARPVVAEQLIEDTIAAARTHGAVVPGIPMTDLVDADLRPVAGTLVRVQTPQAFRAGLLLEAYTRAEVDGFAGTDTAACVERYAGVPVHCVPGDPRNIKVTYRADVPLAEALLTP